MTDAPAPAGPDPRTVPLRAFVAGVGACGLAALACSQLVAAWAAVLAVALGLAGAWASYALVSPADAARRKAVSIGTLSAVALYAVYLTLTSNGDPADGLTTVGPLLATLIVGTHVAHSVVLNGRHDLLVGLVIGLVMTVLAAGLSPGLVVAVPLLVSWPASVAALVLAHRLTETEGADAVAALHKVPAGAHRPGPAARVATVVAVCTVVGLALFLVLPQPHGISARSRLLSGADSPDQTGSGSTTASRSPSYYTDGYLDLRVRGGLSDDPVLEVPAGSPTLWRGSVLDVYDGSGWQSSQVGGRSMGTGPDYSVPLSAEDRADVTPATSAVRLRTAGNGVVVAPGPVTGVHADSGHLVQVGTGLMLLDTGGGIAQYTVDWLPEDLDAATLRAATGADPRDRRWTELPASVPLRVRELAAQVTAGARTRYDAVGAVERYLRGNETYRLDSPVPAPGEDPVDDFLFVSHEGFCEQFASAEVVLLRSRGIPARLVTGFAGGTDAPGDRRVVLASDAHAWVEVWYPGVGWSSSDPTAGSRLAPDGERSALGRLVQRLQALASTGGGRLLLAAAVLGLALLTAAAVHLLVWRRRRAAGRRRATTGPEPGPVLAAFLRLDAATRAAGGTAARPGETPAEYGFRLPAEARSAVGVLERECFAPSPPGPQEAQEAVRTFDGLTDALRDPPARN